MNQAPASRDRGSPRVGKKQIALKRQVSVPDNPVIVQAQHAIQARFTVNGNIDIHTRSTLIQANGADLSTQCHRKLLGFDGR
ncbi:hypothetical protein ACEQA5_004520 [Salmonella enterica]